ncbi:MAG: hypothetical protein JW841_05265 [Deltaproteobacteria bacterium]|nr:hypothetical protein [Deltaproteobacteria bacterium]
MFTLSCGGLPQFSADLGKQVKHNKTIRIPYASITSYFGYIEPGSEADELREGKKMYYLYLWIPVVAPEIGVRMLSPVAGFTKPEKGDFISKAYAKKGVDDDTNYFDTWVRVERCLTALSPGDITKPCMKWVNLGDNDDSAEMPKNPGGNQYNSLMRITSTPDDPLKSIVRGMYRIAFTTFKRGEVKGSFLAQVGAPIELPRVAIAKTPDELFQSVTASEAN